MKYRYLISLCLLAIGALFSVSAEAASLNVGNCEGKAGSGVSKMGAGTISAATIVAASRLPEYEDAKITSIRICLTSTNNVGNLRAWIRHSLDGENLDSAIIAEPQEGWNEVALPKALILDPTKDLVIGYSFDQPKPTKCMALGGSFMRNGFWLAKDGDWEDRSYATQRVLSAEVIITGDNVPNANLSITSVSSPDVLYYGKTYTLECGIKNTGNTDFNGYKYTYTIGDNEYSETVAVDKPFAQYATDVISVSFPSSMFERCVKKPVALSVIAEGDDFPSDNTITRYLTTYIDSVAHTLLLEEFTTEPCGNCPRASDAIQAMLNKGYGNQVAVIAHHEGYRTDWLTTDENYQLMWLYGEEGTYAPAGMFNRTNNPNYHIAICDDMNAPMFAIGNADDFEPKFKKALQEPAFVSITATASYEQASRTITIDVEIDKLDTFDGQCERPRLSVYILEDSISHHNQMGIGDRQNYHHRHVFRKALTNIWGDEIEFHGSKATGSYSYALPHDWNPCFISAVAFVNNFNPKDINDCKVYNVAEADIKEQSGVTALNGETITGIEYYNLQGMRLAAPQQGQPVIRRLLLSSGAAKSEVTIMQ